MKSAPNLKVFFLFAVTAAHEATKNTSKYHCGLFIEHSLYKVGCSEIDSYEGL